MLFVLYVYIFFSIFIVTLRDLHPTPRGEGNKLTKQHRNRLVQTCRLEFLLRILPSNVVNTLSNEPSDTNRG